MSSLSLSMRRSISSGSDMGPMSGSKLSLEESLVSQGNLLSNSRSNNSVVCPSKFTSRIVYRLCFFPSPIVLAKCVNIVS
jgi:hypothetical protein